jgi:hypothetical protein
LYKLNQELSIVLEYSELNFSTLQKEWQYCK